MRFALASLVLALALVAGCNSTPAANDTGSGGNDTGTGGNDTGTGGNDTGTGGNDAGNDAASVMSDAGSDTGTAVTDAGSDAGGASDTGSAATDAGCDGVLLTVINVLSWCDVTVNGGTAFGGATETVCVPAASDVTLVHTAHTGFILGDWFGTDGDSGSGDPGTVAGTMSTAHVTTGAAGTSACVSVCCPFTSGTGCPSTDSCP